jgi:two-component system cell cycle response regulator DivK
MTLSLKEEYMAKLILIVEDEPRNLTLVRDLLQVSGYKTIEATDGEQGVELAKSKKPDLILMDVQMPKMDGLEATRILKADATTSNIPVLALTSYAMKGDKERILEAGCDGYIAKPIDIKEFLKLVTEYLSE